MSNSPRSSTPRGPKSQSETGENTQSPDSLLFQFPKAERQPVYFNCHEFQAYTASIAHSQKLIQLSTYNVGIHEDTSTFVRAYVDQLCRAGEVHLLVGTNPYHPEIDRITAELDSYNQNKNLTIRILPKIHCKLLIMDNIGWAGSLNLIHPSLCDVMVEVTKEQRKILELEFGRFWQRASRF